MGMAENHKLHILPCFPDIFSVMDQKNGNALQFKPQRFRQLPGPAAVIVPPCFGKGGYDIIYPPVMGGQLRFALVGYAAAPFVTWCG